MLKPGDVVRTTSGYPCRVIKRLGGGTQGDVYEVEIPGQRAVLKWAKRNTQVPRQQIEKLVLSPRPDKAFLWPMAMVEAGDDFGYLMPLLPDAQLPLTRLIDGSDIGVEVSFQFLLSIAAEIVRAFRMIFDQGWVYSDISDANISFDPIGRTVCICDNDNVRPEATNSPYTIGTDGYKAPELVRDNSLQSSLGSERHALAVLLFRILLRHHPLLGAKERQHILLDADAELELYGTDPIFIFDPDDTSNGPLLGHHDGVVALWEMYPQDLRDLFVKAFCDGLRDPSARPDFSDWANVLDQIQRRLYRCPCGAELFKVGSIDDSKACWNCKRSASAALIQKDQQETHYAPSLSIVNQGTDTIYIISPAKKTIPIGQSESARLLDTSIINAGSIRAVIGPADTQPTDSSQPTALRITNKGDESFSVLSIDGTLVQLRKGQSSIIRPGYILSF